MPTLVLRKCDIRREAYRASGPGGQHRNKTETAIRLVHTPTGVTAQCATERSQRSNYLDALRMLVARLERRLRDEAEAAIEARREARPRPSFGNRRRSYVLCGQARVIDHVTGQEADPDDVLRGCLDGLLRASLLHETRHNA